MVKMDEKVLSKFKEIDNLDYFNVKIFAEYRDLDNIEVINKLFLNDKKKSKR